MKAGSRSVFCVLGALVLILSGCASAKPYQRGHLSKAKMRLIQDAEAVMLEQHVFAFREGSIGGYGGASSGCGCN